MGKYYIRKLNTPRLKFEDISPAWLEHNLKCYPHGYFKGGISADYDEEYLLTECNTVRSYGMFSYIMNQVNK